MRLPTRRSELTARYRKARDPHLTPAKIEALKRELTDLEKYRLPVAAAELRRTAEMGDLSENAAYQEAKDTLRRLNGRILSLRQRIASAIPITKNALSDRVALGTTVTVRLEDRTLTYEIVGSDEASPSRGRISSHSPVGAVLMNRRKGDIVTVQIGGKSRSYEIVSIA